MDLHKLKLEKFTTYNGYNMPETFDPGLTLSDTPQTYFLFLSTFEDVNRLTNKVLNNQQHIENRVFFVYKKGQKTLHRDHVATYIKASPFLVMKAPMLCSLNKTYSCFTCMIKK